MTRSDLSECLGCEVVTVALFGSVATGESDELSDIDVLVVCKEEAAELVPNLRHSWAQCLQVGDDELVVYTRDVVEKMARGGAVLLQHVKLEGVVLLDRESWFESLRIAPFSDFDGELRLLERLLEDVAEAWEARRPKTLLDLHALAIVIRNACILLTLHAGQPAFGRMSALRVAKQVAPSTPVSEELYGELVLWRRNYRTATKLVTFPSAERCGEYLSLARATLEFVRRVVWSAPR